MQPIRVVLCSNKRTGLLAGKKKRGPGGPHYSRPGGQRYSFMGRRARPAGLWKERIVGVTLEQSETLNLLRLEGAVGIGCAAEFKGLLEQALASGGEVQVSLQGATDLDVTAVQLLWAAGRKAKGGGVEYSIAGAPPEQVVAALSEAGLQQFMVPMSVE